MAPETAVQLSTALVEEGEDDDDVNVIVEVGDGDTEFCFTSWLVAVPVYGTAVSVVTFAESVELAVAVATSEAAATEDEEIRVSPVDVLVDGAIVREVLVDIGLIGVGDDDAVPT